MFKLFEFLILKNDRPVMGRLAPATLAEGTTPDSPGRVAASSRCSSLASVSDNTAKCVTTIVMARTRRKNNVLHSAGDGHLV